MPSDTPLPRPVALFLVRVEKYVLPFVYAGLAWRQVGFFRARYAALAMARLHSATLTEQNLQVGALLKHALIFALMVFTGGTLLCNRPPTVLPDKLKHIAVPLAMSFYFVLYGVVDGLPPPWRDNLLPTGWQLPCGLAGLALSVAGYALSAWAVLCLGRAFALLVSVRQVVLGGPYAYVRHPIYAGYLLDALGLLLVTGSAAMCALVAGFVALLVIRARLEEETLGAASAEYRRHLRRTGFLFPRRWPGSPAPE